MSWLTIAWSMCASMNFMLCFMHLALWFIDRRKSAYLLSALMALSAGVGAFDELAQMHAESVAIYVRLLVWQNTLVYLILVPMVWFIYVHFGTARRWLAILITILWTIALAANFLSPASLIFTEIQQLEHRFTFWGEAYNIAVGTRNPWVLLAESATPLIVIFTLDATLRAWRKGVSRSTVTIGVAMVLFITSAGIHAPLVDAGIVKTPYMISFAFLAIVLAMSWDLVYRAIRVDRELQSNRYELYRLARVNQLGELASALAHELNQPLAAILSNAQAARRFMDCDPPADPDQVRDIVDDIIRDDKRAGSVIRRLHSMLHKGEVSRERFDLGQAVEEVVGLFRKEAANRKIDLRIEPAHSLPPISAGRVEIQQLLINLLSNAIRATEDASPDPAEIVIRTRSIGGFAEVSVLDRGPGLDEDQQPSIFEPFVTSKSQGIGMGLAICQRIVDAHGGHIQGKNRAGGGAVFTFTLPLEPAGG